MAVEVPAGMVVVLSGAWIGATGKDLGITEWHTGLGSAGDRTMPQGLRTAVAGDAGDLGC